MIKAVLFDMNGVIIDDEAVHEMAFAATLAPFGLEVTHQIYLDCCAGRTDAAGYERLAAHFHQNLPLSQLLADKASQYLQLFPTHKRAFPGVIELIKNVSSHYTLALVSGAVRPEVELVLQSFGVRELFTVVVSADDVTFSKPHPDPYARAVVALKLKPSECVVIEDSPSGVESGLAAGCACIAVTTTHSQESLQKATVVVSDFGQISPEMINQLAS